MKKKITLTFTNDMADMLSYLSAIMSKNQNQILEEAFWEWWNSQDEYIKNSLNEIIQITNKIRDAEGTHVN